MRLCGFAGGEGMTRELKRSLYKSRRVPGLKPWPISEARARANAGILRCAQNDKCWGRREKQIPFGNDKQGARATAEAEALRE